MPEEIFELLSKKSNPKSVAQKIKSGAAMGRATSDNPELVIAINNAGKIASESKISDEMVRKIIESDTELTLAAQDNDFRREFADLLKDINEEAVFVENPKVKIPGFSSGGSTGGAAAKPSAPEPESDSQALKIKPSSEIYRKLLAILEQIPSARPGAIITDEHHNTLHAAVRAIAALLSEPDERKKFVLTFPPYFKPSLIEEREEKNSADWIVTFNKAVVPPQKIRDETIETVRGAVMIQMPQGAEIKKVIVRGRRLSNEVAPKVCAVHFLRLPHESEKNLREEANFTLPDPVAVFDLKEEKDFFELSVEPKGKAAMVDNKEFQYVITGIWEGGKETDRYEIYAVQAFCER